MLGILWLLAFSGISSKASSESTDKLVFRPLMHQPRIYAGAPPGVHVTTVHAYDPDRPRKKVEYNLPNVFDYQTFVVDQLSGNLTTAKPINKDIGEMYEVMVAAVSHSSSELQHLQIAVTEFNQFAPRFENRKYVIEMHPKTAINTSILQVQAIDPDPSLYNAEIYYKMDQNLTSKYFSLNSLTGNLTLIHPFNETANNLHFGIFAEDGGSPKRWDYVPVYVDLKNISAPVNVGVVSVTYSSAVICWEEPFYGDVLRYEISYHPKKVPIPILINATVDYDMDICQDLEDLHDDTDYVVQVRGWNEREMGQQSEPLHFRTSKNWCGRFLCNAGTCESLTEDPWYICHCPPGFSGPFCQFYDICITNTCINNGKCKNISSNEYICICTDHYTGPNCEYRNPCFENHCENGGTCEMTLNNSYHCICAEGFYGRKCQTRDPCVTGPCYNGGTCIFLINDTFQCLCPPGFTGLTCEKEINYCESDPCSGGATCVNNGENYACICPEGYTGNNCNIASECPAERTPAVGGFYEWNATKHGSMVLVKCSFVPSKSLNREAFLVRQCFLVNGIATWGEIDRSNCSLKSLAHAVEYAEELHNITKNPSSLDTETLQVAAQGIEAISVQATKNKMLAQGMFDVISNVMGVNDTVIEQTDSETFDSLLQSIDDFVSNVELEPGQSMRVGAENVRIQTLEWHPGFETKGDHMTYGDHIALSAPVAKGIVDEGVIEETISTTAMDASYPTLTTEDNITIAAGPTEKTKPPVFQVFVPKEALQEAHKQLDKSVRIKFVVYYNDKLFQSKTAPQPTPEPDPTTDKNEDENPGDTEPREMEDESPIKTPVLQISVGNVSLTNLHQPLVYILPMVTKRTASCVYWKEKEKKWSLEGLETTQKIDRVICRSSHMTAFSVLLDFTPEVQLSETHNKILSIASYIGSSLSILGLLATILTYSMFRCLNRDYPGKILLNLCISLLMMNSAFLVGASSLVRHPDVCAAVAVCTHYLVLTSLSWMCAEAINMRHLLVHVFASGETHFMLKRVCLAWGLPFVVVAATASVRFDAYHNNLDNCVLSSDDTWVYYFSYLGPSSIILIANLIIFLRVSRVICTPKLAVRNSQTQSRRVTVAQIRGAFTVLVLLGVTWVFGTLAIGKVRIVFQYLFCVLNSLQGFSIFLVRCLLYPEAKNAWIYLLHTGKFKTHRGVVPPGTVSFTSNSGGRNGTSPNTTVRTESTDEGLSNDQKSFSRQQAGSFVKNSPSTMSIRRKQFDKHPNFHRSINRVETGNFDCSWDGQRFQYQSGVNCRRNNMCDLIEMQGKLDKNRKNEYNAIKSLNSHQYNEDKHNDAFCYPRGVDDVPKLEEYPIKVAFPISVEFEKVKMKKKTKSEVNTKDHLGNGYKPERDRNALLRISPTPRKIKNGMPMKVSTHTLNDFRSHENKILSSPIDSTKGRRSRSLDNGSSSNYSCPSKRGKAIKRIRENPNTDSVFLEVDEGVHSDAGSSSTDIDDGPLESSPRFRNQSIIR